MSISRLRRFSARALIGASFAGALGLVVDWQIDNAALRHQAHEITKNLNTDSARIRAINDWVYAQGGFGQNTHYFIVPALGPTPIQVLQAGGDCADKSRLVAAMLNELNIDAGLVMLSPCLKCGFIHTVVEAQYENGRMVVDPVWHVDYPSRDGGFLGVGDLAGTSLGRERIAALKKERGAADKIGLMPATEATFDYAVPVNWDKNAISRSVAAILRLAGHVPEQITRPRFLEDPKFALWIFLVLVGMALLMAKVMTDLSQAFVKRIAGRRSSGISKRIETVDLLPRADIATR
jgi:hypothetical protein